jgi:AAA+ ATPase superfamily predicted ATPase
MGKVFERIAKEFVIHINEIPGKLPFKLNKIGRWWHREEEIDIVGMNPQKKRAILFEVKWKELGKEDVTRIFKELERKSGSLRLQGYRIDLGIIAQKARHKEGFVFDLGDFDIQ